MGVHRTWALLASRHTAQNSISSKVTEGGTKLRRQKVIKYFTDRCLHTFVSTVDTGLREKRMT